jgi:membrane protease YdiL (CAAX protease family)
MSTETMEKGGAERFDRGRGDAGWLAIVFVFAPVPAVSLIMAALATMRHGAPTHMISWLLYSAACWIDVAALWTWARGHGLSAEIFRFRSPSAADIAIAIIGAALLFFLYTPIVWLCGRYGFEFQGMNFDVGDPVVVAAVTFWAVVSAPFCEEVLFRGLAVQTLQSRGYGLWLVWLLPVAAFAAIHLPVFGVAGVFYILVWGGVVTAIRLWRGNLTPGWILHVINNLVAFLVIPLLRHASA